MLPCKSSYSARHLTEQIAYKYIYLWIKFCLFDVDSVKLNYSKAAKNTALERLNFTQEKRKGQRFSFLFEPPKGGMGDLYVRYKTEIQRRI